MSGRLHILALMISSTLLLGSVISQEINVSILAPQEELVTGQEMTLLDTNENSSGEGAYQSGVYEGGQEIPNLLTGEEDNALTTGLLYTGDTTGEFLPYLQITEVYVDGTDEWIEITNQGQQVFSGTITIQGVKATSLTLKNITISGMSSQLFGDTIAQLLDTSCINMTGLGLNMGDTLAIAIVLIVSGQKNQTILVDTATVQQYNDTKTSFEYREHDRKAVTLDRTSNALSGYTMNPGISFPDEEGEETPPTPTETTGTLLLLCSGQEMLDDPPLQIREIFGGKSDTPRYIEVAVQDDITIDSLSISGDLIGGFYEFSGENTGITIQKNTFLLLEANTTRANQKLSSCQFSGVNIGTTGHIIILGWGSGQTRQVLDIVYVSGNNIGKSWYFGEKTYQCARIFDLVDDFSPGFERRFLQYIPVRTETKIEYIFTGTSCASGATGLSNTGQESGGSVLITEQYTIQILNVEYDPPGSDTNNESIILLAHHISGETTPLDMSKVFRVKINGTNKLLSGWLAMDTPTTFTKTFGFPNSTDEGKEVLVELTYGEYVFASYNYTPTPVKVIEPEKPETGYYVSSVIDGKSFRIKYQGITQTARLIGIDTPEYTSQASPLLTCFATETKEYLKNLIDKQKVTIQFDPLQNQRDDQGNLLVYAYLDGLLINQYLLEQGYAKFLTGATPYLQEGLGQQLSEGAQQEVVGLRNPRICGGSWSGIQQSETLTTGAVISGDDELFSGVSVHITYVLPNPIGKDTHEEIGLLITNTEGTSRDKVWDLSQGFTLHIGKKTKKIQGIVHVGQVYILSGNLGLLNSPACIGLRYHEKELTTRCYAQPKEGIKIGENNQLFSSVSVEQREWLTQLQLKKISNKLCIQYAGVSWICKTIPAGKAAAKTTAEQKLYKGLASILKAYLLNDRKQLYYNTDIKMYYDLLTTNKTYIAQGWTQRNVYGQMVSVTDLKKQLQIMQQTLPGIISLFAGQQGLE